MHSLQISDLPDDLYYSLNARALLEHRSLTQQALVELNRSLRDHPDNRRQRVLAQIKTEIIQGELSPELSPEHLIRNDRTR